MAGGMSLGGLGFYAAAPPETVNILVVGIDARSGSGESDTLARTDSIMVLSVNPQNHEVSLFSLPRDVFIQSPTYGYLRSNTVVRNAELNQVGSGMAELVASMENTFGMEIHHYARVNFTAFEDVVDALGGVKIDVPKHIVDNAYPTEDYGTMRVEFFEGEQTMNGETALIYARTRHADDDYQRAARQQQVLEALFAKLSNPFHFYRYPAVLNALLQNIETDMTIADMAWVAPGILLYGNSPNQFVVDRDYIYANGGEAYPVVDSIRPWIETHLR